MIKMFLINILSGTMAKEFRTTIYDRLLRPMDGKILIGTPSGIDVYDPTTNTFKKTPVQNTKTGSENNVICFFKDNKNGIWLVRDQALIFIMMGC